MAQEQPRLPITYGGRVRIRATGMRHTGLSKLRIQVLPRTAEAGKILRHPVRRTRGERERRQVEGREGRAGQGHRASDATEKRATTKATTGKASSRRGSSSTDEASSRRGRSTRAEARAANTYVRASHKAWKSGTSTEKIWPRQPITGKQQQVCRRWGEFCSGLPWELRVCMRVRGLSFRSGRTDRCLLISFDLLGNISVSYSLDSTFYDLPSAPWFWWESRPDHQSPS